MPIAAVPYTISSSGTYYLTQDIVSSGGAGITINAEFVTIDFNGHVLSSSGTTGNGCSSTGRKNIRITNGRIDGFSAGIALSGAGTTGVAVDKIAITNSASNGIVIGGSAGSLAACRIENNSVSLGAGTSTGILVNYRSNAIIARNSVALSGNPSAFAGIAISYSTQIVIKDNLVTGAGTDGIYFYWSNNCHVASNTVSGTVLATGGRT